MTLGHSFNNTKAIRNRPKSDANAAFYFKRSVTVDNIWLDAEAISDAERLAMIRGDNAELRVSAAVLVHTNVPFSTKLSGNASSLAIATQVRYT